MPSCHGAYLSTGTTLPFTFTVRDSEIGAKITELNVGHWNSETISENISDFFKIFLSVQSKMTTKSKRETCVYICLMT